MVREATDQQIILAHSSLRREELSDFNEFVPREELPNLHRAHTEYPLSTKTIFNSVTRGRRRTKKIQYEAHEVHNYPSYSTGAGDDRVS